MQTLAHIRALLESRGLTPRHAFGQNFLIDHNQLSKLIDAAGLSPGDVVLEIGPGTGTLTESLLEKGARVVAAEIDRGMCELLRATMPRGSFTLVEGDCLDGKRALCPAVLEALDGPFKLVSNLPYDAATPAMVILMADVPRCIGLYVTIQLEVAQRLLAGPGSRDYGPVSVLAQAMFEARLIARLPPGCFWPQPKVTSAMVALDRRATPLTTDPRGLVDFAQKLFEQRRKQLGATMARLRPEGSFASVAEFPWPEGSGPTQRAEELSPAVIEALRAAHRGWVKPHAQDG
jgi:16S rRNA (adenine1518-N6/adenine1519-N6)-dimethyltransferase